MLPEAMFIILKNWGENLVFNKRSFK
jgi:hypothetical protein